MTEKAEPSNLQTETNSPLESRTPLTLKELASGAKHAIEHFNGELEFEITLDQEKKHALTLLEAVENSKLTKEDAAEIIAARQGETRMSSDIDFLTDIYNRKGGSRRLLETLFLDSRNKTKTSLIIIDMDGFGDVNNNFGHEAGDRALQALAGHLSISIRGSDIPFRYGGDEFGIILPGTDALKARVVANKISTEVWMSIRSATETYGYKITEPVTISAGLAEENPNQPTNQSISERAQRLTKLADQAALVAKKLGKNRVVVAKDAEGLLTFTDISEGNIYSAIFNNEGKIENIKLLMHG